MLAKIREISIENVGPAGLMEPLLLSRVASSADTAALLGMRLPAGFSEQWLLQVLGPDHPVPTVDVPTQDAGPTLSMEEVSSSTSSSKQRQAGRHRQSGVGSTRDPTRDALSCGVWKHCGAGSGPSEGGGQGQNGSERARMEAAWETIALEGGRFECLALP